MTTPRKMFAAVALASVALFGTAGIALAGPNRVHDGGNDGGHTNSHADQHSQGDDNNCNFKYKRDGSRSHKFDGGNHDCPTINPQVNAPNPAYDNSTATGTAPPIPTGPVAPAGFPSVPGLF